MMPGNLRSRSILTKEVPLLGFIHHRIASEIPLFIRRSSVRSGQPYKKERQFIFCASGALFDYHADLQNFVSSNALTIDQNFE